MIQIITWQYLKLFLCVYSLTGECLLQSLGYRTFRAIANLTAQVHFASNFLLYYAVNPQFQRQAHFLLDKITAACKDRHHPKPCSS